MQCKHIASSFIQRTRACFGIEQWRTVPCALLLLRRCYPLFTAPPLRAGPGYELHRGIGYYKVHSEPRTWQEARRICADEGAHLAIVNSEEESKVLQSILAPVAARLKTVWAFVGFHDLYEEGQYVTIFGK